MSSSDAFSSAVTRNLMTCVLLFGVPGNDDAIRAVKLISGAMADAVLEGKQGKQDAPAAEEAAKAE